MAHPNNYFGFTHGGTQYTGQPATYPAAAAQTAYVHAAAPQAAYATATAPRAPTAYDTYQTAATAGAYAYATTRAPVKVDFLQPNTATYDATKAYYQPAPAATYTVQEATYQTAAAAKPVYAATAYQAPATRQIAAQKPIAVTQQVTQANYSYTPAAPAQQSSNATYSTNTYTPATTSNSATFTGIQNASQNSANQSYKLHGYDAALYSAATSYYQQQQTTPKVTTGATNWFKKSNAFVKKEKPKLPPKQPQLHYCDVCKISCAGPQTYREHLDGQKHKKKEAGQAPPAGRAAQNQLRCELCDVACTGNDAYAAHIRGAKHKKVLKLHTKLGKAIPSTEPVVVGATSSSTTATAKVGNATATISKAKPIPTTGATQVKKVMATPKINFLGGTQLKTAGNKTEEVKTEAAKTDASEGEGQEVEALLPGEKDVQPVGHEYIEEVKNEAGKVISFNCKLCECKFNDPNAKEMHMKGRKHRLQYKKKVDPKLVVEVKPGIRMRKIQEDRMKRNLQREEYWKRRHEEERMMMDEEAHYWEERRRFEDEVMNRQPRFQGPMGMRRPDTSDDRHVIAKHHSIYPKENELQGVQSIVTACEKALKLVSDYIAECDNPTKPEVAEVKKEAGTEETKEGKEEEKKDETATRALKGVMRVGVLAKGLLLHGNLNVNLVVLCTDKPTRSMLDRVADALPKQLATVTEEKFEVRRCVEEAAIIISSDKEPATSCTVTLTSPVMRDQVGEPEVKDPPDVLDRQKCLDALAALRHAKWFQARANGLQSCVVAIRIMRDLCHRVPTWAPLSEWAMELLVEKCISSANGPQAPGDALRRVFECLSSGILMPGGPGLWDPCEKDPKDAAGNLTNQAREDITASAQHALRLISFRQIHKVLGMDPLPAPRFQRPRFNPRKRRRTTSVGENADAEGIEGKKDRKEGEEEPKKDEVAA